MVGRNRMKLTQTQYFAQSQRIAREIIARLNVRLEQEKRKGE